MGTEVDGVIGDTRTNWTSAAPAVPGHNGMSDRADQFWAYDPGSVCSTPYNPYCISQ